MSVSTTATPAIAPYDLYTQLHALYLHESELNFGLVQEVSTAMTHYVAHILALDGSDPLAANFLGLYQQLALSRATRFRRTVMLRLHHLQASATVQAAQRLLGLSTALHIPDSAFASPHCSTSKESIAQQIHLAFLQVSNCSHALLQQLKGLLSAVQIRAHPQYLSPASSTY